MYVLETKRIGEGAFGTVVQSRLRDATSTSGDDYLGPFAIKKVPLFTDYKSRELEILRHASHPNVVTLKFSFNYPNAKDHGKLYQHLVMECLPSTLQLEIKRYHDSQLILPLTHIQVYTFQIARAMSYLHSFGICHRDIKPSNILVDPSTLKLKICDFGSAKRLEPNQPSVAYICSRFYRAPELIIGCSVYSTKIDIWGLGCVLGELYLGRPVFQGSAPMLQLKEITKLLGQPEREWIHKYNPSYHGPIYTSRSFSRLATRFAKQFPNASAEALDLLMKVLTYDPERRLSARHVMAHAYFDELRRQDFKVKPRNSESMIGVRDALFDFDEHELKVLGHLVDRVTAAL